MNVGAGNINNNGQLVPLSVKIGDTVLLPEYGGSEINLDGNTLFIYRDSDVLGVLHKEWILFYHIYLYIFIILSSIFILFFNMPFTNSKFYLFDYFINKLNI